MTFKEKEYRLLLQEKKWAKEKSLITRKLKMKQERNEIKSKKHTPTSKRLVAFLFINCTFIELFTCAILVWSLYLSKTTGIAADMTPLTSLVSTVVAEVLGFAVYAAKSAKENSVNGITYLTAKYELDNRQDNEQVFENDEDLK